MSEHGEVFQDCDEHCWEAAVHDLPCPYCEIDRLKADLRDSGIALKDAIASIQAHKAELERYAGGVEFVETIDKFGNLAFCMGAPFGLKTDQTVTVLVRAKGEWL